MAVMIVLVKMAMVVMMVVVVTIAVGVMMVMTVIMGTVVVVMVMMVHTSAVRNILDWVIFKRSYFVSNAAFLRAIVRSLTLNFAHGSLLRYCYGIARKLVGMGLIVPPRKSHTLVHHNSLRGMSKCLV